MHEHVAQLGPQATPGDPPRVSALPHDLLEQVRGRVPTAESVLQGTPAFIAPEQALGGADVDGRADIYATGEWWATNEWA